MSKRDYLAAHTPCEHPYPPYINISREDGKIAIIIRSPAAMSAVRADGTAFPISGSEGRIALGEDDFVALVREALGNLGYTTLVCSK